jgi:RHS repeat-associated protein
VQITENGHTVHFYYGADRSRMFKVADPNSQGQKEYTWYVGLGPEGGALYEQKALVDADGVVVKREHLHFLYAGGYHNGQPFAVRVQEEDNHNVVRYDGTEYYHRDHLGSVIAVTRDLGVTADAAGDMHASLLSFDAFGKRRNVDWSDTPGGADQYSPSSRGNLDYTGHEAITEVGLIHMNGRVYDPGLGVFLSADPNIQAASMSQNYNRYSYVLNNPLKYNDPSGYFFSMVMALVVSATIDQIAVQMVAIAIASLMETKGDLRTALIMAVSAGVAHGIGEMFQATACYTPTIEFGRALGKALVHGFTQAMFSEALGGDFRGGFTGGFMSSITGPMVPKGLVEGTLVSAMIGGTISELTGGKFRNGARSAAIVHLFNELGDHGKRLGERKATLRKAYDKSAVAAAAANRLKFYQGLSNEGWAGAHIIDLLGEEGFTQGMPLDEVLGNFDKLVGEYRSEIRDMRAQQETSLQAIILENTSAMLNSSAVYAIDKSIEVIVKPGSTIRNGLGTLTDHAIGKLGERKVSISCALRGCQVD